MDQELFFSGYCRAQDASRTVCLECYDGRCQADCDWPGCPYAAGCPIAQNLEAHSKE